MNDPEITYQELNVSETELLAAEAVISDVEDTLYKNSYRFDSYIPQELETLAENLRSRFNSLSEDLKDEYCDRYFEAVRDVVNTKKYVEYISGVQLDIHLGKCEGYTLAQLEELESNLQEKYSKLPAVMKETVLDDCAETIVELTDLQNDTVEKSVEDLLKESTKENWTGFRPGNYKLKAPASLKAKDQLDSIQKHLAAGKYDALALEKLEKIEHNFKRAYASLSESDQEFRLSDCSQTIVELNDLQNIRKEELEDTAEFTLNNLFAEYDQDSWSNYAGMHTAPSKSRSFKTYVTVPGQRNSVVDVSAADVELIDMDRASLYLYNSVNTVENEAVLDNHKGTPAVLPENAMKKLEAIILSEKPNYASVYAQESGKPMKRNRALSYLAGAALAALTGFTAMMIGYHHATSPQTDNAIESYTLPAASVENTAAVPQKVRLEAYAPRPVYSLSNPLFLEPVKKSVSHQAPLAAKKIQTIKPAPLPKIVPEPVDIYAELDLPREDIYAELEAPQEDIYAELEMETPHEDEDIYAVVDQWYDYQLRGGILSFEEYVDAINKAHPYKKY